MVDNKNINIKGGFRMDQIQLTELKDSYYEYINQVPQGLNVIVTLLEDNKLDAAFNSIANLAEGLEFLLKIEEALKQQNLYINSRIDEVMSTFHEINETLQNEDIVLLKDLIEYELVPAFSSASEWIFVEEVK